MRLTIKVYADENVIFESVFENPGKEASVDIKTQENQASINEVKGPEVTEAIIEEIAPLTNEIKEPEVTETVIEEIAPSTDEVEELEITEVVSEKINTVVEAEASPKDQITKVVSNTHEVAKNYIAIDKNFNLNEAISQPGIVLICFSAKRSSIFADNRQILKDIAAELGSNIKIYTLMMDRHYRVAKSLGINHLPAICMYKDGNKIGNKEGFYEKEALKEWINSPGANIAPTKAPKATKEEQRKPASPVASNDTKNNITKKSPETREIKSEPETIADTIIEIKSEPETVAEKVIRIITEKLGLEEGEAQLNSKLVNDLWADSLDFAELILEIEGDFSISIPEKIYEEARDISVKELIELVESLTK